LTKVYRFGQPVDPDFKRLYFSHLPVNRMANLGAFGQPLLFARAFTYLELIERGDIRRRGAGVHYSRPCGLAEAFAYHL
jgi:hypothetical protein